MCTRRRSRRAYPHRTAPPQRQSQRLFSQEQPIKLYTASLAVALAFGLCQVAAADEPAAVVQDARSPDLVAPAVAASQNPQPPASQDLRTPDQIAPAGVSQDFRAPDQSTSAPSVLASPVAATDAIASADGGLSTLWIVLICLAGVAALAAAGYTTMRVAHAHGRPSG